MNYLLIALYTLAIFVIGLLAGIALRASLDAEAFRMIEAENRDLHRENAKLKKQAAPEVIEIRDERPEPENFFAPF